MRNTLFVSTEGKVLKFLFDLSIFLFCLALFLTILIVVESESLPTYVMILIFLGTGLSFAGMVFCFYRMFQNQLKLSKTLFDIDQENVKITYLNGFEIFALKDLGARIRISKNANGELRLLEFKGKTKKHNLLVFDGIQELWGQIESKVGRITNVEYGFAVELKNYATFLFYWLVLSGIWLTVDQLYLQLGFSLFLFVLFGLGCFLFLLRPIKNYFGLYLNTIERVCSLFLTSPFIIHSLFFVLIPHLMNREELFFDCKEYSPLRACYKISEDSCLKVWEKTKPPCETEINQKMDLDKHPTLLVGPMMKRCRENIFHKSLKYMQKIDGPEMCKRYFKSVSGPDHQ